jgi:hypothetical protein
MIKYATYQRVPIFSKEALELNLKYSNANKTFSAIGTPT